MATAAMREGGKEWEGRQEGPGNHLGLEMWVPGFWNLTSQLREPLCKSKNCSAAWSSSPGEAEALTLASPAAGFPLSSPVDGGDVGKPRSHPPSLLALEGTSAPSSVRLCHGAGGEGRVSCGMSSEQLHSGITEIQETAFTENLGFNAKPSPRST